VSAEAYSTAEKTSFGEGLYWAISTMTTVGYLAPHTTAGKIVACIAMLVGVGFFAIITGAIAQRFLSVEVVELEEEEQDLLTRVRLISDQLRELEREIAQTPQRARSR